MNAEKFVKKAPLTSLGSSYRHAKFIAGKLYRIPLNEKIRITFNTVTNPGTQFDCFNTVIEWDPNNPASIVFNIASTVLCTSLRLYAEVKKTEGFKDPDIDKDKKPVTRIIEHRASSTGFAGVTQLLVAGSCALTGNFAAISLPAAFGIGDIATAVNAVIQDRKSSTKTDISDEKKPENLVTVSKDKNFLSVGGSILLTAENYFCYGLSKGQHVYIHHMHVPDYFFGAAAILGTAQQIPVLSRLANNNLGWFGRQLNQQHTTFGLLAMGCGIVALNSHLQVGISYAAFGFAYLVIPTLKSNGLYEVLQKRFARRATAATPT